MTFRSATWWAVLPGLMALAGCFYPVRSKIDAEVCDIAKPAYDLQNLDATPAKPAMPPAEDAGHAEEGDAVALASAKEIEGDEERPGKRFDPFKDLEKYRRPALQLPPDLLPEGAPKPFRPGPLDSPQRREILRREFQPLQPPGPDEEGAPGPFGHPLTLSELQKLGLSNAPAIKQAVAAVAVARGNAFQSGLMPNPTIGFETDTFGTTGGAGYVGGFMEQLFRTGGKLRLNRAVAAMDLRNAEVDLRRAQMDLLTRVRTGYFQVLVARENMRINRILLAFVTAAYELQAGQVRGRAEQTVAAYEPMYLRALANIVRTQLIAARNSYQVAWKQLAATLGLPGLPVTQLAGRVDMPVPDFDFHKVWLWVGKNHTDVVRADNTLQQARFALLLAQVQPYPDVDMRFLIQKDYTGPPNAVAPSIMVSLPVPFYNRNQGGIAAAQANVVQMSQEPERVRYDLYGRLSEAYGRYATARQNLELYRSAILPDLVRVYDAILQRYQREAPVVPPAPAAPPAAPPGVPVQPLPPAVQSPPPTINDVVVAQGYLTQNIASYVLTLGQMWQAAVDVTDLIQTSDMFRLNDEPLPTSPSPALALPDLQQLKPLPPAHPCSPLPDPKLRGGDGAWPPAIPTRNNPPMPPAEARAP